MSLAMDVSGLPVYESSTSRSEPRQEADKTPEKGFFSRFRIRQGLLVGLLLVLLVCLLDVVSLGLRGFVLVGLPTEVEIFPEAMRPFTDATILVKLAPPRFQSYLHSLSIQGGGVGATSCTVAFRDAASAKPTIQTITHVIFDSPQLDIPNLALDDAQPSSPKVLQFSLERTDFTPINNFMHDASPFKTDTSELHVACSVHFSLLLFSFLPLPLHHLQVYRMSGNTPGTSYTEFGLPIPGLRIGAISSSANDGKIPLPSSSSSAAEEQQQRRLALATAPNPGAPAALDTTLTIKLRDTGVTQSASSNAQSSTPHRLSRPLISNSSAVICNRDGESDNLPSFLTVCLGAALDSSSLNLPFAMTLHAPALDLSVGQSTFEHGAGDSESSGWRLSTRAFVLSLPALTDGEKGASSLTVALLSTNVTLSCFDESNSKAREKCTLLYPTSPLLTHMANGHAVVKTHFSNAPNFISSLLGPKHVVDYSSFDGALVSTSAAPQQRQLSTADANSTAVASNLFKCMRVLMDTWEFGNGCVNVNSLLFNVHVVIDSWYGRLITANAAAAWTVGKEGARLVDSTANVSFVEYLIASNNLSYNEAAGALNESAAMWIQGEERLRLEASSNWNRTQLLSEVLLPGIMHSTVTWWGEAISFGLGNWTWQATNTTSNSTEGSLSISALESSEPIFFGNTPAQPRVSFSGLAIPNVTSISQWECRMQDLSLFVNMGSGVDIMAQAFFGAQVSPDGRSNQGIEADVLLEVNGDQIVVTSNKVAWSVPPGDMALIAADSMGVIGTGNGTSWEVAAKVAFESLSPEISTYDALPALPKPMEADLVIRTNHPKSYFYDWVSVFRSNASRYSVTLDLELTADNSYWYNSYLYQPHSYNSALLETLEVLSFSNASFSSFDFGLSAFRSSWYFSCANWYQDWSHGFQYCLKGYNDADWGVGYENHKATVQIYNLQIDINELFNTIATLKASLDAGKFLKQYATSLASRGATPQQPINSLGLKLVLIDAKIQKIGDARPEYFQVQRESQSLHNITLHATGEYSGTSWSSWLLGVNASSFRVNGVELAELSGNVTVDVGYQGFMSVNAVESLRGQNNFVGEAVGTWNFSDAYSGSAEVHSTGLAPDRAAWLLLGNMSYSPLAVGSNNNILPTTTFQASLMPRMWNFAFDLSGKNIEAVYQYLSVPQPAQTDCRIAIQVYDAYLDDFLWQHESWINVIKEALASVMSVPGTQLSAQNFTKGNTETLNFGYTLQRSWWSWWQTDTVMQSVNLEFNIINPSLGQYWGPPPLICAELQDQLKRRLNNDNLLMNRAIQFYANQSQLPVAAAMPPPPPPFYAGAGSGDKLQTTEMRSGNIYGQSSRTIFVRIPDHSVPFHVVGSGAGLFGGDSSSQSSPSWFLHVEESAVVSEGIVLANVSADLSMNIDTRGFIRVQAFAGGDPEKVFVTDNNIAWDFNDTMNGLLSATSTSMLLDWEISSPVIAWNMTLGLQYFPHGSSPQFPNLNLVSPVFSSPVVMQFQNYGASVVEAGAHKTKNSQNPRPPPPPPSGAQVQQGYQFGRSNSVLFQGVRYSTLSDVSIDIYYYCCTSQYYWIAIPPGWQLAVDSAPVRTLIAKFGWQTDHVMVMTGAGTSRKGKSYGTKNRGGGFYSDDGDIQTGYQYYYGAPLSVYNSNGGQTLISLCKAGQYSDGTSFSCSTCPAGTYSPLPGATSGTSCVSCGPGMYASPGASACTVACPPGTFGDTMTGNCSPCLAGTFSPLSGLKSSSECMKCPAGSFGQSLGATSASACLPCGPVGSGSIGASTCLGQANLVSVMGVYWSTLNDVPVDDPNVGVLCQDAAARIPAGWQLAPSTKDVRMLVAAAHLWSTQHVVLANGDVVKTLLWLSQDRRDPAGTLTGTSGLVQFGGSYMPQSCSKQILIRTCLPGSYSTGDTPNCLLCAAGKYSSILGATSPTSCLPCASRAFSTAGASSCSYSSSSCPAGSYASGSACASCPAGKFSSAIGATACLQCLSGFFSPNAGATTCLPCKSNTPAGASRCFGRSNVLHANDNTYSTLGDVEVDTHTVTCQSKPLQLPAGWGICHDTSDVISSVVSQHFWSSPSLLLADGKLISTKTDNLIGGAVWGFDGFSHATNGTVYMPANCNSQILLQLCSPGLYNNNTNIECTRCPAGTFASNFGTAKCSACLPGLRSAAGASSCSTAACPSGTRASGAACIAVQMLHGEALAEQSLSDLIHDKFSRRRLSSSSSSSSSSSGSSSSGGDVPQVVGGAAGLRSFIFDVSLLEGKAYSSKHRNWRWWYTPTPNGQRQTISACTSTTVYLGVSWATYQLHASEYDAVLKIVSASYFQANFPDYVVISCDATGDNDYLAVSVVYYDAETLGSASCSTEIDFLTTSVSGCEYADPDRRLGWSCRQELTDQLLQAISANTAAVGLLDIVANVGRTYSYDWLPNLNYSSSSNSNSNYGDDFLTLGEDSLLLQAGAVGTYLGDSVQGPWVLTFTNLSIFAGGASNNLSQPTPRSVSTIVDGIDGMMTFRPQTNVSDGIFDLSSFKMDTLNASFSSGWNRVNDTMHMTLQNRLDVYNKKVYDAGINLAWQQPHVNPPAPKVAPFTQADVLRDFFLAMGSSARALTNWNFSRSLNVSRSLCASASRQPAFAWAGVSCDWRTKRVTSLSLGKLGLAGQLPHSLGDPALASSLTLLDLSGNALEGTIPTTLASLTKLVSLNLGSNPNLAGSLGSPFCRLAQKPQNATVNVAKTGVVCFAKCWLGVRPTFRFVRDASLLECSKRPTGQPTSQPSRQPSGQPSRRPTRQPTRQPTGQPTRQPIRRPTGQPTTQPTNPTSAAPSRSPSSQPSRMPSAQPSSQPTRQPSSQPSGQPSRQPSRQPSAQPSRQPSGQPSRQPSRQPTGQPSAAPSSQPISLPSSRPTRQPTGQPSRQPSRQPTGQPTRQPSIQPSAQPTSQPSGQPSRQPSRQPSAQPSAQPSRQPSGQPSRQPVTTPTVPPTKTTSPTPAPTVLPTANPTISPTSSRPTLRPTKDPTGQPTSTPTSPTGMPSSNARLRAGVNLAISGLSLSQARAPSMQASIIQAFASTVDITPRYVTIDSVTAAAAAAAARQQEGRRLGVGGVVVSMSINAPVSAFGALGASGSGSASAAVLAKKASGAAFSQSFVAALQSIDSVAQSLQLSVSAVVSDLTPTPSPTAAAEASQRSEAPITTLITAVGVVVFLVVSGIICFSKRDVLRSFFFNARARKVYMVETLGGQEGIQASSPLSRPGSPSRSSRDAPLPTSARTSTRNQPTSPAPAAYLAYPAYQSTKSGGGSTPGAGDAATWADAALPTNQFISDEELLQTFATLRQIRSSQK